ncbi:hypothetical protein ACFL55_02755 [Candidatus Latescibacterota bacterium]
MMSRSRAVTITVICLSLCLFAIQCGQQEQQQSAVQQQVDCLPSASQTLPSMNILMLVGNENGRVIPGTGIADNFLQNRLELEMGHTTTLMPDTTAADVMLAAADAADLVIFCESISSAAILTDLYTTATPILSMEAFLQDDLGLVDNTTWRVDPGAPSDEDSLGANPGYGAIEGETDIIIVDPSDPLAAGLPRGRVQVYRFLKELNWGAAVVPSAHVVATCAGGEDQAGNVIYYVRKGQPLYGGTPAPGLRVQLFIENDNQTGTINLMTAEGYRLLDAAVNYCLTTDPATHVASPTPPAPSGRYMPRPR